MLCTKQLPVQEKHTPDNLIPFNLKVTLCMYFLLGSVIVGCLEQILQKEGFRGMYRGLSPTVLALLPTWAVSFSSITSEG